MGFFAVTAVTVAVAASAIKHTFVGFCHQAHLRRARHRLSAATVASTVLDTLIGWRSSSQAVIGASVNRASVSRASVSPERVGQARVGRAHAGRTRVDRASVGRASGPSERGRTGQFARVGGPGCGFVCTVMSTFE